ncbi:MAG: D-alanyl-D-alanine carboxypeptidase [Bdellovibrionota bacterium]
MKNSLKTIIAGLVLVTAITTQARVITSCSSEGYDGALKGSSNMHSSMPIASVSKVFTSLWAAERLGLDYRYPTQIYLTKLNDGTHNVHLRGSAFPYFDRVMFYFLIGELNKRGVKAINELTYDENFEYASIVRSKSDLVHSNGEQSETEIMRELRADVEDLKSRYASYLARTQPLVKNTLPKSVSLSVKNIAAQSMKVFNAANATSTFMLRSSELHRTLKELNRNSHNFAADKVYERLARTEKFSSYLTTVVGAADKEFSFYNGSGYPEYVDGRKVYNSASCRTVVEVMKRLTQIATKQGKALRYVLPLAGADSRSDGNSTVTNIYLANNTDESVLAKTGTISQSVSLAGAALTQDGVVFFHATSSTQDYTSIRNFLAGIIKSNGGKDPVDNYKAQAFVPFDENSIQEVM